MARTTVPPHSAWTAMLCATPRSLEPTNQEMTISPRRTKERQEAIRKMALSERSLTTKYSFWILFGL
jgi:hypothetical protein